MTAVTEKPVDMTVKSQLAKLLATENISVQHNPSVTTAMFDVKSRSLILPVWQNISEDLYDMLVVHEVGHALDTPADAWEQAVKTMTEKKTGNKSFLNVIEDARIDKRQKRRYPGSRRNYVKGYKELFERNFFGTQGKDVNGMMFIDRINLYFKGGAMLGIIFTKAEKALVDKIADAETFEEVVALTEEVYAFCKKLNEEKKQQEQNQDSAEDSDDNDSVDSDSYDYLDNEDSDSDADADADADAESDDSDEDESNQSKYANDETFEDEESGEDQAETDKLGAGADESDDETLEAATERAAQEAMSTIVADNDINYVYVTLPKAKYENIVDDFSVVIPQMLATYNTYGDYTRKTVREDLKKFRQSENDSISFMVKEFEMRKAADSYARASVAKTGVIDTNKLHSYKYNDDIFRKLSVVPNSKNHGFFMILDWSGSMLTNFKYTMKQLIALTLFCKRVQIPFEVYSFKDDRGFTQKGSFEYKTNDLRFDNFKMRNILSSRMNAATLNTAFELLWAQASRAVYYPTDSMDGTPLNQAIVVSDKLINDFRKKYKLEIVNTIILTDGCSDPCMSIHNPAILPPKKNGTRYILKDDVTKATHVIGRSLYDMTDLLLKVLKSRTNTNLIGFYLHNGGIKSLNWIIDYTILNNDKTKKLWNDEGYLSTTAKGYDEYYIVKCGGKTAGADVLDVNAKMTKAKIAKAFIKYSEKKTTNRVLLSKFMARVSAKVA